MKFLKSGMFIILCIFAAILLLVGCDINEKQAIIGDSKDSESVFESNSDTILESENNYDTEESAFLPESENDSNLITEKDWAYYESHLADPEEIDDQKLKDIGDDLLAFFRKNGLGEQISYETELPDAEELNALLEDTELGYLGFGLILEDKNLSTYKSNGVLEINEKTFELPIRPEELNRNGWYVKDNNGQTLPYGYFGSVPMYNDSDGYSLYCRICNDYSDSGITFDKSTVIGIGLDDTYYSSGYKDPYIVFDGKVSTQSSLSETINALGVPHSIFLTVWYEDGHYDRSECQIEYDNRIKYTVRFEFDLDSKRMIDYDYEIDAFDSNK